MAPIAVKCHIIPVMPSVSKSCSNATVSGCREMAVSGCREMGGTHKYMSVSVAVWYGPNATDMQCATLFGPLPLSCSPRVDMKLSGKRIGDVLNRMHVAVPKTRDNTARPAVIPPSVAAARAAAAATAAAKAKRKTEKDLQEGNGGAGEGRWMCQGEGGWALVLLCDVRGCTLAQSRMS
jgi:hypothetical protein